MLRRPILIFLGVMALLIGSAVAFLQSRTFATVVRQVLDRTVPDELGMKARFSDFQLHAFPPGVSIREPELLLQERNFLGVAPESRIRAARLELRFRPFQMLAGKVRIEQVRLVESDVLLPLSMAQKKTSTGLHWKDLIQIRVQSVALERSVLRLQWPGESSELVLSVNQAELTRFGPESDGTFLFRSELERLTFFRGKSATSLSNVSVAAEVGPRGVNVTRLQARTSTNLDGQSISLNGLVSGDIFGSAPLKASFDLELAGDAWGLKRWLRGETSSAWVTPLAPSLPVNRNRDEIFGELRVRGHLDIPNLLKIEQSAIFDGKVSFDRGKLAGWSFAHLESGVKVVSKPDRQLDLTLEKLSIRQTSQESVSSAKLAIRLKRGELAAIEPFSVELEQAPLLWLLGPHASSVDNLDARLSGKAELRITSGKSFLLQAKTHLQSPFLKVFAGPTEDKKSALVLRTVPFSIDGTFQVSADRFLPEKLQWKFNKSLFDITGVVDWSQVDTRWDLRAKGGAQLSDLVELGGKSISGEGQIQARVHGLASRLDVDFDTQLKGARYLDLEYGDLEGRFSLVDDQSVLLFQGVRGKKGATDYSVNGPIDFRGEGSIDLDIRFPAGRIEDFLSVFKPLTRELSWFPDSLRGRAQVEGRVQGGLGLDALRVEAQLQGSDWVYFGERFRSVRLGGGYDRGTYHFDGIDLKKRSGGAQGDVSFAPGGKFQWKLQTQGFSLRDFDWLLRLNIPIRGDLQVVSEGSGSMDALESSTVLSLTRTSIRSQSFPASVLRVMSRDGVWSASGRGLGEQAQLDWSHDRRSMATNRLRISLDEVDFTPLLLILNPANLQDQNLKGAASGEIDLSYRGSQIESASGQVTLDRFQIQKTGSWMRLAERVSARMNLGDLALPEAKILGDRGSELLFRLAARKGSWDCSLGGELDLSALEYVSPLVVQGSGKATLSLALRGLISEPYLSGTVDLRDGYLRTRLIESPLENLQGRVLIRGGKFTLSGFQSVLAQGRASGSGQVEFFPDRWPRVDLIAQLEENRLKIYPFQYLKIRNARLVVAGASLPYEISGEVSVEQGLSREKLSSAGKGIVQESSLYAPPPSADSVFDYPKFRLNLDVRADSGLVFQNELLDVEMRASMKVVNTIEAPRLLGQAELVPGQGRLTFKDHVFQVQTAVIKFEDPTALNPLFDLVATTEISSTKVQLYTSGKSDRFKVELSSNPVLPEAEILSLLAMGRTIEESQRLRAASTSGVQQSEAASLILQSLDFNRDVREKTGFQVGVGEAQNTMAGNSVFRPQSDIDSSIVPKIVLKRQVGRRMDVSVGSTVGAGTTNQKEVNADFYVSPSVSVRGVWNFFEGSTSQDASTSSLQQSRTSYGIDLKLQKRFK
ncbi:MAG: hypothetical protein RJB38_1693 [Pseudomonadota bacterium]